MAVDSQYLNSGQAQTGTAGEANVIPRSDANGNIFFNAIGGTQFINATGTAAGTLGNLFSSILYGGSTTATYTMPPEAKGAKFTIVNGTSNALTLTPNGAELINQSTNTISVGTNFGGRMIFPDPSTNSGYIVF